MHTLSSTLKKLQFLSKLFTTIFKFLHFPTPGLIRLAGNLLIHTLSSTLKKL
jgi:hypothetical protein